MRNYIIMQFIIVKGCLYMGGNKYKSLPIEMYISIAYTNNVVRGPLCAKISTHGKIYHCNLCAYRYYQISEAHGIVVLLIIIIVH